MFKVTYVNSQNSDKFLGVVSEHALLESDHFIGVYDVNTDTACGVAAFSAISETEISLNFIYVDENWRGMGAGDTLIDALSTYAQKAGFTEIVCTFAVGEDEKDELSDFLLETGFDMEEQEPVYSVKASDVWVGNQGIKAGDLIYEVVPLSDADGKTWRGFENYCEENSENDNLIIADLENRLYYDSRLSCMAVNPDTGKCHGALLFKSGEDYVTPLVFYMGGSAPGKTALMLLVYSFNFIKTKYVRDPYIYMCFPDERGMTLFKRFCKNEPKVAGNSYEFRLYL